MEWTEWKHTGRDAGGLYGNGNNKGKGIFYRRENNTTVIYRARFNGKDWVEVETLQQIEHGMRHEEAISMCRQFAD